MAQRRERDKGAIGLLILSIVLLINPVVKVVDILPDFIACFIIARLLTYAADRAPYFEEARVEFMRLGFVSIARIPAFIIVSYAKSNNVQDFDTSTLMTLVFAVIEGYLLFSALTNLFRGAFYLGERGTASAMLSPFKLGRRRTMTPEDLRTLTFIFIVLKEALCFLPELLLLTQSTDPGIHVQVFRPMRYYPYAIVLSVIVVFIFSIFFAKRAITYIRVINSEGKFTSSLDGLIGEERALEIEAKVKVRGINRTISFLITATIFTVELCFDNFDGINLVPHFISAIFLLAALISLRKHTDTCTGAYVISGIYTAACVLTYVLKIRFSNEHGFDSLVKGTEAKSAYLPVIFSAIFEFATFTALAVFVTIALIRLIRTHTGVSSESPSYSRSDEVAYKKKERLAVIWSALGVISAGAKLADVGLKYYSNLTLVAVDGGIGNVVSGLIPWFNLVVIATALIHIAFTLYFLTGLKEDVELKYS